MQFDISIDPTFIVEDPIPFREFVTVDNNLMTEEIRDPTDMTVFVETYTVSEEDPAEDSEKCQQPVSIKDAANAVEMVIRFMEASEDYSLPEINSFENWGKNPKRERKNDEANTDFWFFLKNT